MDEQIETLDEQTEKEIEIALDKLRSVQFCDNTYTQAVEAHEEVEVIICSLAKRLKPRATYSEKVIQEKVNEWFGEINQRPIVVLVQDIIKQLLKNRAD